MSFSDLMDDADDMIMASLNDGRVDYFTAAGALLASGLEVIAETGVERVNVQSGTVDRVMTLSVRKALLTPFDRKGSFASSTSAPVKALGGKVWHIDGIVEDDGQLITFYVVP